MGWIIFGGIALLIAALLASPVVARVEYSEELRLKISWLFVTILSVPAKTKRAAKRDKKTERGALDLDRAAADTAAAVSPAEKGSAPADKAQSAEKSGKTADKAKNAHKPAAGKKDKASLSELFELVKALVDSLGKPLKKLLHRTVIARLRINVVCGGEDAAQAALNFGKMNILVGNILGWTDVYFTLKKPDDIHIDVDFRREDTAAEISFTARLSVFAALAFLLKAFGRAVGHYRKSPSLRRTIEKLRATPHN